MAVKVTGNNPQTKAPTTSQHGNGTGIDVRDGHLLVVDGLDQIAIYAPGHWTHAEVTK